MGGPNFELNSKTSVKLAERFEELAKRLWELAESTQKELKRELLEALRELKRTLSKKKIPTIWSV